MNLKAQQQKLSKIPCGTKWQRVHLPGQETQEMQVWSFSQEDPPEERMATHSSILVWRIPWTEEPGGLQSIGSQRVGHDWSDLAHTHTKWKPESEKNPFLLPHLHQKQSVSCRSITGSLKCMKLGSLKEAIDKGVWTENIFEEIMA